ncbi:MAG: hypothetical protein GY793_01150 [Proteobacteria bacterium]|nr:hypothetical protein [Pseudomonadota bacterium]
MTTKKESYIERKNKTATYCDIIRNSKRPNKVQGKFDKFTLSSGRHPTNFRKLHEEVDPKFMTRKEFIHYLYHLFKLNLNTGWDGIERHPHTPNWTADPAHNIKTRTEALDFLQKANKKTKTKLSVNFFLLFWLFIVIINIT